MRVLLLADIHANLPALKAVLAAGAVLQYDEIWCLGDIVGYGPFPNECARLVRQKARRVIAGNHDVKVISAKKIAAMVDQKKEEYKIFVFRWTHRVLAPDVVKYLGSLRESARFVVAGRRVVLTHDGIPRIPADVLLVGHTHEAFVRKVGGTLVANPGSVGRPFDGDPRASFMVLDFTPKGVDVTTHRVAYDGASVADEMRRLGFRKLLIKAFIEARSPGDILSDGGRERSGRTQRSLMPHNGEKYFMGIDVGGTKIFGGLVTPAGTIVAQHKESTPLKARPGQILAVIEKLVKVLLKQADVLPRHILGMGVAVPGIVDNAGKVVITPNIDLNGVELKKILEKKYKVRVVVGNDVNFGVMGEKWLGAGRKAAHVIGLFPGTGVGGGIIVKGDFVTGHQGAAAELGHMTVDPKGPLCTCGNTGCLEAIAGRWAIERDIRAAVGKGSRTIITELAGQNFKQIKSGTLAKALKAKDPVVVRIMARAADALASACVTLNHIFNTEVFIFGGGVIEACGDFILPRVERALKKDPFFRDLQSPRVVAAKLGDDAVMLGAVAAVRQGAGQSATSSPYYPKLKVMPSGKVSVNATLIDKPFYLRADGKLKEPDEFVPPHITTDLVEELTKKGPDVLFIAMGKKKHLTFSPKATRYLKKKHITARLLPVLSAVKAYNTCEERKAMFFYL